MAKRQLKPGQLPPCPKTIVELPTDAAIAERLAVIRRAAQYLRAYGPGDRVKKEIFAALSHTLDELSPLGAFHIGPSVDTKRQAAAGKLLLALGRLMRQCIKPSPATACDPKATADLLDMLANDVEDKGAPPLIPNDARNKFCFDQWQAGQTLKAIRVAVSKHPEWEHLAHDASVRGPIKAWGKRINAKPRKGNPGRHRALK
jgi:hypothetical protein